MGEGDPLGQQCICLNCIGDEALRELVADRAPPQTCNFCSSSSAAIEIDDLVGVIDEPLRTYCQQGDVVPRFATNSDTPDYEQEGELLEWFLQAELGVDHAPAHAIGKRLVDLDPAWPPDGEEPFFDDTQCYHRIEIGDYTHAERWEAFVRRISHERRFFDSQARSDLEEILGDPSDLPYRIVGGGSEPAPVYRARVVRSETEARLILGDPVAQLGPPPAATSPHGRMNAAGISVFYGALAEATAVAEVRPSVGALVVVGQFEITHGLRILDLTQLGRTYSGSIFRSDYPERASRQSFLEGFHARLARPIQPNEESIAYVPTQALAEFVEEAHSFEGILYGSAQIGAGFGRYDYEDLDGENANLVLFESAPNGSGEQDAIKLFGLSYKVDSARVVRISAMQVEYRSFYLPKRGGDDRDGHLDDYSF